jgi:hypothetical protein
MLDRHLRYGPTRRCIGRAGFRPAQQPYATISGEIVARAQFLTRVICVTSGERSFESLRTALQSLLASNDGCVAGRNEMTVARVLVVLAFAVVAGMVLTSVPGAAYGAATGADQQGAGLAAVPAACVALTAPGQISPATVVSFDELPVGTSIGSYYQRTHGVTFEDGRTTRVIVYDHPLPHSAPLVAQSETSGDPAATGLNFYFDTAQASVGMRVGNGGGVTMARLQGFDADGNQVCSAQIANVPDGHAAFIGFRDDTRRIVSASLTYVDSIQAESIDDLLFSAELLPTETPAATPASTATPTGASTVTGTPTPTATRPAPPSAALFVSPSGVAPGGQPRVGGYGFPAAVDLQLILTCPGQMDIDLGAARTDATGRLQASLTAPAYPPNPCLVSARQGAVRLASADLTLLQGLELSFSPQTGPPGAEVSFTARNLVAGDFRLDYAGRVVVGPLRVAAGSHSGSFVIPNDRPVPLGAEAELRASSLILGRVVGTTAGHFRSQAAPPPPAYRVTDLQLPAADLPAGGHFNITGRISPAPQEPLSQFQVVPVWRKADGRTFPIGRGAAQIAADGGFSAAVRVPSLLTGDPTWPEAGDQVGVMLITAANPPQSFLQPITGVPIFPNFNVKVVDAATGQLIPSAKVSFEVWQGYQASANSLPLGEVAGAAATGVTNQIGQVLGATELTDDEKAYLALMKAICKPLTIPVNSDKWELINPTLDQTISEPTVQGLLLANSVLMEAAAAMGQDAASADMMLPARATGGQPPGFAAPGAAPAGAPAAGEVIPYLLTVDALDAGYGLKDAGGAVKNLSLLVNFHLADLSYRDLKGSILSNPYTVKLGKVSSGDQSALGPIEVFVAGIGAPELPSPTALPRFARYHSAKNIPAGVQVTKHADGSVQVTLSYAQFHKLGAGGMQLYVDGAWQASFDLQFNPGLSCKNGTIKWTSEPFYQGKALIPNAHLLAPGPRAIQVRAQIQGGQWVNYNYILQVDALPASWFAAQSAGTRTLAWRPGEVKLFTPWLSPGSHTQLLHSDPAKTDETGQLDNRTIPTGNISQQAQANGHKGGQTTGQLSGQALNRYGKGASFSHSAPAAAAGTGAPPAKTARANAPQATDANPVSSYTYGPYKENVVPEVTFNLPEVKYGIPFVAEIAAGGSMSYAASVTYQGITTLMDDGAAQSKLTIDPEANVNGTVYVEGRLLAGLIGKAGASLTANFDAHMPVTYDTAKSNPLTAGAYFEYGADFKAWHKWGCVPYAGCAYSKTYPKHLFDGCEVLSGPVACPASASAQAAGSIGAPDPPQFDLQLAANGHGRVMAVWQQTRTSLATSVFNGVTWTSAGSIVTGFGSSQPQIAFLDPKRAVAVWTETNLAEAQLPSLSGEDLLRAQRIAYAVWDGAGWSAAQPLTAPSLGEGGPTLAACPAWQVGCPAGGAAMAVWERNLSSNAEARAIRLYYARYENGAWSSPQPVDSAGAFTDILPQVSYVNGAPLVAWVRDSDVDLADGASRRIALCFLGGSAAFIPAELPPGIAEVALGVDTAGQPVLAFTRFEDATQMLGNRRPLWAAAVSCSGPATCTWHPVKLTDAAGRTLYAEQPRLTPGPAGQILVTFRGIGYGGDADAQPGDPPGMTGGQGELAQAALNFATGQVAPKYLTQDAAVNWLPAAAYDPLLGAIVATAIQGSIPAVEAETAAATVMSTVSPAPDLPIAAAAVAALPDFALADASVAGGPATGKPLRLTAAIANAGAAWPGSAGQPLEVVATWDGPPGIGAPAGIIALSSLGPAPFVTVTLDLALPPAGLDAAHELYVVVNPGFPISETEAANNGQTLAVGDIAAPGSLWAQVKPGSAIVFLGWNAVADRRVAGYRVYRSEAGGAWAPIGGSFAPGYVDIGARQGGGYRYAVTAYAAVGSESALSAPIGMSGLPLRSYLPMVLR